LCDTALGAYDAEQTNRSSSFFGARGSRPMRRPWRMAGGARPCAPPRFSGRSLDGSLLGCLRKDVALCDTASWARVAYGYGSWGGRHISCAPSGCMTGCGCKGASGDGSCLHASCMQGRSLERKFAGLLT